MFGRWSNRSWSTRWALLERSGRWASPPIGRTSSKHKTHTASLQQRCHFCRAPHGDASSRTNLPAHVPPTLLRPGVSSGSFYRRSIWGIRPGAARIQEPYFRSEVGAQCLDLNEYTRAKGRFVSSTSAFSRTAASVTPVFSKSEPRLGVCWGSSEQHLCMASGVQAPRNRLVLRKDHVALTLVQIRGVSDHFGRVFPSDHSAGFRVDQRRPPERAPERAQCTRARGSTRGARRRRPRRRLDQTPQHVEEEGVGPSSLGRTSWQDRSSWQQRWQQDRGSRWHRWQEDEQQQQLQESGRESVAAGERRAQADSDDATVGYRSEFIVVGAQRRLASCARHRPRARVAGGRADVYWCRWGGPEQRVRSSGGARTSAWSRSQKARIRANAGAAGTI